MLELTTNNVMKRVLPYNLQFFAEDQIDPAPADPKDPKYTKYPTSVKTPEEIRAEINKEYEAKLQKETDKRVTEALKKRDKEFANKLAKEKMSEDERKRAEEAERAQVQARQAYELIIKDIKLDVVDAVAELGLDAGFRNLIAVEDLASITDDAKRKDKLTERVKGMKALFDKEVEKAVARAKADFLKGNTPSSGNPKRIPLLNSSEV